MITAAASVACPKLNALNHNVLDGFTTGTQHIIQLNHPEVLQKFYMTKIPSKVADVIDNSLSELPLRGEFVLTLDKNCRVTLDWRSMSIFNFHRLLKILRQQRDPMSDPLMRQKPCLENCLTLLTNSASHVLLPISSQSLISWRPKMAPSKNHQHSWLS